MSVVTPMNRMKQGRSGVKLRGSGVGLMPRIEGGRKGKRGGLNCGGFLPGSGDRTASLFGLSLSLCFVQRPRLETATAGCEH